MKAYMAYADEPQEGACLIFAHSVKEAAKHAWPIIRSWWGCDYTDMRVKMEKDAYLFDYADKVKMAADEAHAIECPPTCKRCELWGMGKFNGEGICESCLDNIESEVDAMTPADRIERVDKGSK